MISDSAAHELIHVLSAIGLLVLWTCVIVLIRSINKLRDRMDEIVQRFDEQAQGTVDLHNRGVAVHQATLREIEEVKTRLASLEQVN